MRDAGGVSTVFDKNARDTGGVSAVFDKNTRDTGEFRLFFDKNARDMGVIRVCWTVGIGLFTDAEVFEYIAKHFVGGDLATSYFG